MNIHVNSLTAPIAHEDIVKGVPASKVMALVNKGILHREDVFAAISERTFMRRLAAKEALKMEEADAVGRMLRVRALAYWAFPDKADAEEFLASPNPALGGQSPRALALTDAGARKVEGLVHRFVHGDFA